MPARGIDSRNSYLTVLGEIATTIGQSIDLPTLLDATFRRILVLLERDAGAIFLLDESGRQLVLAVHQGLSAEMVRDVARLRVGDQLSGHVAVTGQPVFVDDMSADPRVSILTARHEGLRTFAGVPLTARGRVVGVLNLVSRRHRPFRQADRELLGTVGNLLGVAIENARLLEETRRRALEWQSIVELGKEVVSNSDPDVVLDAVLRKAQKLLGTDVAFLALILDGGRRLKLHRGIGLRAPRMLRLETPGDAGVGGMVRELGQPIIVYDYANDPRLKHPPRGPVVEDEGLVSFIAVPFGVRGDFLGILHVANRHPTHFTERDAELIAAFANEAAIAVENGQRQAAAEARRQRLQTILDSMPQGVMLLAAPDGRVDMLNAIGQHWLGPSVRSGEPLDSSLPLSARSGARLAPAELPVVRSLLAGEVHTATEIVVEQPDGRRLPLLFSSAPLHGADGQITGAVGVFQDISRLKEVERLKDDFLSLVSHELRGPLTGIKGIVSSLRQPDIDWDGETRQTFLQYVEREADRLSDLVDNLLDMARIDAAGSRVNVEPCHIADIVHGAIERVATLLGETSIQVEVPEDLGEVQAEFRQMVSVIANLLGNAAKYSPDGSPITVRAQREGNQVVVSVTDCGVGIPPDVLPQIFDRFYRGPIPRGKRIEGAGLGLAICRGIVTAHGGTITVQSQSGHGSTFTISLPLGTET